MVDITEITTSQEISQEITSNSSQYETDNDLSDTSSIHHESLLDRFYALSDAFPLHTRLSLIRNAEYCFYSGLQLVKVAGNCAWVVATCAMVLVLPGALEIEKESSGLLQEHQQRGTQQQTQLE